MISKGRTPPYLASELELFLCREQAADPLADLGGASTRNSLPTTALNTCSLEGKNKVQGRLDMCAASARSAMVTRL